MKRWKSTVNRKIKKNFIDRHFWRGIYILCSIHCGKKLITQYFNYIKKHVGKKLTKKKKVACHIVNFASKLISLAQHKHIAIQAMSIRGERPAPPSPRHTPFLSANFFLKLSYEWPPSKINEINIKIEVVSTTHPPPHTHTSIKILKIEDWDWGGGVQDFRWVCPFQNRCFVPAIWNSVGQFFRTLTQLYNE